MEYRSQSGGALMPHMEQWVLRGPFMNMIPKMEFGCFLHGVLSGHLLIADCKNAITSPLVDFDPVAKTATTLSGSEYTLGEPSDGYKKFLEGHHVKA